MSGQQTISGQSVVVVPHTVNRLVFRSAGSYDELRARYEAAVSAFDWSMIDTAASWDEVLERTAAAAPTGSCCTGGSRSTRS
jgi:hypothetical protein